MKAIFNVTLAIVICLAGGGVFAQSTAARAEQQRFRLAADYSRENRGLSVVVLKGDKIVFEEYQNGHSADRAWILASGTKSFSGVMLAAAIEDKLISGFDEKAADTITEWKGDARKSKITIRQVLSLTSGIEAGQIGMPGAKVTWDGVMWQTTIHMAFILSAIGIAWVDKMMNAPAPHKPKH